MDNLEIKEKFNAVSEALLDFVLRVVKNPSATPAELQNMSEVAKVVLEVLKLQHIKNLCGVSYCDCHKENNNVSYWSTNNKQEDFESIPQ